MQLGKFLDAAKNRPAVTRPVKFKLAAKNQGSQPTSVEVEAVLAYVDEEERADLAVAASSYLAEKFPGKQITSAEQSNELTFRLLAAALRDKDDPVKPLCDMGVDQLRPCLLFTVAKDLSQQYQDFIEAEYPVAPFEDDVEKMKKSATGESQPVRP